MDVSKSIGKEKSWRLLIIEDLKRKFIYEVDVLEESARVWNELQRLNK